MRTCLGTANQARHSQPTIGASFFDSDSTRRSISASEVLSSAPPIATSGPLGAILAGVFIDRTSNPTIELSTVVYM